MDFIKQSLSKSLQTGFLDHLIHSNKEYLPELLVNNPLIGKKVLTTIERELNQCEEFWFSVAFVTTSGVATIINKLTELQEKNIKGKILVSQYLNFSQPEALRRLLKFNNIELKIATKGNFHSKGYLFNNGSFDDLIIGSSNLTSSALCINTEWNLKISATKESYIIKSVTNEFQLEFEKALPVTEDYINHYDKVYQQQKEIIKSQQQQNLEAFQEIISPNSMQSQALQNLKEIRLKGKNKALLISATGTGKTFLSAFDVHNFNPQKFLFIVHRGNIAKAAMKTFKAVFGQSKNMGMYTGDLKEKDCDFLFSTIQTISKDEHLNQFNQNYFDYIVIDESHRAGADSYKKIINYFKPKFLLGMTATPERTDDFDIFSLYDHTVAYEIRLHTALEEDMLSPFHYYGVRDISVGGKVLDEKSDFRLLTSDERINRIIDTANYYGTDNGLVRGLIFCSKIEECIELSKEFNKRNYKTVALVNGSSEEARAEAINKLESDNINEKLDYIFTVDIFNEGVDIPKVNQIIMLRPTQSAIVFVQQLGRGLRKAENKEYLTVIDFIGNYSNSYLVPVALYGDTSYNKDTLRKIMSDGSSFIPGTSTINFDKISKELIFNSINSASMLKKRDLVTDYNSLKHRLGRMPLMVDFIECGSRDPYLYVDYAKSYFNFVSLQEDELKGKLNSGEIKALELFSNDINNGKRVYESILVRELIKNETISKISLKNIIEKEFNFLISDYTIDSIIKNLNFEFITENHNKRLIPISEKYGIKYLECIGNNITFHPNFLIFLQNPTFKKFIIDNTNYAIMIYRRKFERHKFYDGFILYEKYSRKDVFRILNWESNPLAQNVGGYIFSKDKKNSPLFVTYKKEDNISSTTKYNDHFIDNLEFEMMSKSKRNLNSPEIKAWMTGSDNIRIPLFIKKSNDEGTEFYYMGDVKPIENGFEQTTMPADDEKPVSVVKIRFSMQVPVEDSIYNYITI